MRVRYIHFVLNYFTKAISLKFHILTFRFQQFLINKFKLNYFTKVLNVQFGKTLLFFLKTLIIFTIETNFTSFKCQSKITNLSFTNTNIFNDTGFPDGSKLNRKADKLKKPSIVKLPMTLANRSLQQYIHSPFSTYSRMVQDV